VFFVLFVVINPDRFEHEGGMQAERHSAGAATDSLLAHGGTDIAEVAETQRSQSFLVVGFLPGV